MVSLRYYPLPSEERVALNKLRCRRTGKAKNRTTKLRTLCFITTNRTATNLDVLEVIMGYCVVV